MRWPISAIDHTLNALIALTKALPVGTNLGLLHVLWMLVSGKLLAQRGALFPALLSIGLSDAAARRAWLAFRGGAWHIRELLGCWQRYVEERADFAVHRHEGYRVVTLDVTAFFRPKLKNCPSKHFHPIAGRALPAVIIGIVGQVGDIGGQRLALPRAFERVHPTDGQEKRLWANLLRQVKHHLAADEIAVADAGVKIRDFQCSGIERYCVRLPVNFTARRNTLPPYGGKGRKPVYGQLVRPLPRQFKHKTLAATPPDYLEQWQENGRTITAHVWYNLVLPAVKPDQDAPTFNVYAIFDPLYQTPWLLATPLDLRPMTVKALYTDRWPVEQLPLAAKHMLGAHRQFVHAPEMIQRLPELALLAGSVLSFLAATAPATPTGFWDTHPKPTPGRFRRQLIGQPFPQSYPLPSQFRKKQSVTAHLPKGILAVHSKILRAQRSPSSKLNPPPAAPI